MIHMGFSTERNVCSVRISVITNGLETIQWVGNTEEVLSIDDPSARVGELPLAFRGREAWSAVDQP